MDVREKLVEILRKPIFPHELVDPIEAVADYLLDSGVTVQEWVSVKDRLPTIHDANADNCVLAIHKVTNRRYYHWRTVVDNPFDFTFWSKVPQPPKGE